ncbi:MAG TPA: DNA starvation/stationary phase protection protein [Actinomycetota bacterium]|nr:DNA starvation/stationary phase protection protein [Actinomycetota bacterium]
MAGTRMQGMGIPEVALPDRDRLGGELQSMLVDLVALSLDGKQAHWHVTGEHFAPVHEQLDRIVDDARAWADLVAERAVTLGITVDGRPETVAARSATPSFPTGWLADAEAVRLMSERVERVVVRLRQSLEDLGRLDLATQDLALEMARGLEKHLWMLRAQLA